MAKSVAKIKDLIRALKLEKDANRDLLDHLKHHEAVLLQLEQTQQRIERLEKELRQSKTQTQDAIDNGKRIEKEVLRAEKEFAQYRQEVEKPTQKVIAALKRHWDDSKRSDELEPGWSMPDFSKPPPEGFLLRPDGFIDTSLGRIRLWQNNFQVSSAGWVLMNRKNCQCELVGGGFVVCERNLPDWDVLHPEDRNKTVYAAYSLKKPVRLVASFSRETVLSRISAKEYRSGRRVVVQISGKRNINVNLSTPLERLNPDYFTNKVCREDERATVDAAVKQNEQ